MAQCTNKWREIWEQLPNTRPTLFALGGILWRTSQNTIHVHLIQIRGPGILQYSWDLSLTCRYFKIKLEYHCFQRIRLQKVVPDKEKTNSKDDGAYRGFIRQTSCLYFHHYNSDIIVFCWVKRLLELITKVLKLILFSWFILQRVVPIAKKWPCPILLYSCYRTLKMSFSANTGNK